MNIELPELIERGEVSLDLIQSIYLSGLDIIGNANTTGFTCELDDPQVWIIRNGVPFYIGIYSYCEDYGCIQAMRFLLSVLLLELLVGKEAHRISENKPELVQIIYSYRLIYTSQTLLEMLDFIESNLIDDIKMGKIRSREDEEEENKRQRR